MKTIAVLIALSATVGLAQTEFPREMHLFHKGGTIDTVSRTSADSVTFSVANRIVINRRNSTADSVCVAGIDSITFPFVGGPAITLHEPAPGRVFSIGDSMTVSWTINPACINDRVAILLSLNDGTGSPSSWREICVPNRGSGSCQPAKSSTAIYSGNTGTMKIRLINPMLDANGIDQYSPVSDSCRIQIYQYESGGMYRDLQATSGRFAVRP